jgi:predicted DNA-binding transcriptional regulator AlpA
MRHLDSDEDDLPANRTAHDPSIARSHPLRMLRLAQVIERTGLRKAKIYELQSEGRFPMRVKITAHAVGWIEHEVQAWLASRVAENNPLRTHGSRA